MLLGSSLFSMPKRENLGPSSGTTTLFVCVREEEMRRHIPRLSSLTNQKTLDRSKHHCCDRDRQAKVTHEKAGCLGHDGCSQLFLLDGLPAPAGADISFLLFITFGSHPPGTTKASHFWVLARCRFSQSPSRPRELTHAQSAAASCLPGAAP